MEYITTSFKLLAFTAILASVTFAVTFLTNMSAIEFLAYLAGTFFIGFILTMHDAIIPYLKLAFSIGVIAIIIMAGMKII